jgi:hypothetical protein
MRRTACPVIDSDGECVEPKDTGLGDGFCTAHSRSWRQSAEFREAAKDKAVIFAAQLRIPSLLNRALRPHKKRWLKRMESAGEDD